MKPIIDPTQVEHIGKFLREMMLTEKDRETEFNPGWVRSHGWKVVPAESMARIPIPEIPRIVSALNGAGYAACTAVFNEAGYIQDLPVVVSGEPSGDMATCYLLSVNEADFREFNHAFGAFRSVLTAEDGSWAISCNELYNLFAGKPELLEAMLGKSVELAKSPDDHQLLVARYYETL